MYYELYNKVKYCCHCSANCNRVRLPLTLPLVWVVPVKRHCADHPIDNQWQITLGCICLVIANNRPPLLISDSKTYFRIFNKIILTFDYRSYIKICILHMFPVVKNGNEPNCELSGVFGDGHNESKSSVPKWVRLRLGSDNDLWILGSAPISCSKITKIYNNYVIGQFAWFGWLINSLIALIAYPFKEGSFVSLE